MSLENTKEVLVLHYTLTSKTKTPENISKLVGISVEKVVKIQNNHLKINEK